MWYVIAIRTHLLCFSRQLVPQFSLHGLERENMPEKVDEEATRQLYDYFIERLREACPPEQVKNGDLESKMDIKPLENQPIHFNYQSEDEMVHAYLSFDSMH
jgi:D-Tyr-tRNAtyr deacylase